MKYFAIAAFVVLAGAAAFYVSSQKPQGPVVSEWKRTFVEPVAAHPAAHEELKWRPDADVIEMRAPASKKK
ncbi:MAG TPA: hypothetical protein PKC28_06835 [Bdellovibrionales bacterium]|nr:hypothetical protein [Bdellovibrionales bacterium]